MIKKGLIQMTLPDKPTSPKQKYYIYYKIITLLFAVKD